MFKCEVSGRVSLPKEKGHKIVTKTRKRIYYDDLGKEISRGWEIVQEKLVCQEVYNTMKAKGE